MLKLSLLYLVKLSSFVFSGRYGGSRYMRFCVPVTFLSAVA